MIYRRKPIFFRSKIVNKSKKRTIKNKRRNNIVKNQDNKNNKNNKDDKDNNSNRNNNVNQEKKKNSEIILFPNISKNLNKNLLPYHPLKIAYEVKEGYSLLNKIYDQIYMINLKKRSDRMHLMKYKLQEMGIKYVKIDAVDGSKFNDQFLRFKSERMRINGAYGLLCTFVSIIEDAKLKKYKKILVLEDDCNFHENFDKMLAERKNLFNFQMTPIIYLGATQPGWSPKIKKQIRNNKFYHKDFSTNTWGTFAISFHESIYNLLLNRINGMEKAPIDGIFKDIINKNKIKALVFYPNLIIADRSTSDIQISIMKNEGNHQIGKYASRGRWNLNKYTYLSLVDYLALMKNIRKLNINQLEERLSKTALINLLKQNKVNIKLANRTVAFIFRNRNEINKDKLKRFINN